MVSNFLTFSEYGLLVAFLKATLNPFTFSNNKTLGFIIEKIDILSHWYFRGENGNIGAPIGDGFLNSNQRSSPNVDNAFRYNVTEAQLKKLKRIAKQYPDFKFHIFDELFDLKQFWDLDDETFKDILTDGRYYSYSIKQQQYLKDIIVSGKLDKWLEIKKKNDFLPRSAIFLDQNLTERFGFR